MCSYRYEKNQKDLSNVKTPLALQQLTWCCVEFTEKHYTPFFLRREHYAPKNTSKQYVKKKIR